MTIDPAQHHIDQGYAAHHVGDLPLALSLYQSAADTLRPINQPLRLAHTIRHVADIQRHLNLLDQAHANYAEALAIYRAQPGTGQLDLANTLRPYALLMETLGDIPAARAMWTEARDLYAIVNVQAGVDEAERRIKELTARG